MRMPFVLLPFVLISVLGSEYQDQYNFTKPNRYLTTRSASLAPIRILYHFVSFDLGSSSANSEFQTQIIKNVEAFFSNALLVNPFLDYLTVSPPTCGPNIVVPRTHQDPGVSNYDFVVYLTTESQTSAWYDAFSGVCDHEGTLRNEVTVGYIVINSQNFGLLDQNRKFITVLQEMTKILGFSPELYDYWKNAQGELYANDTLYKNVNIRGTNKFMIVTPNVVAKAKEAFGCSTLEGVELEEFNEVGVASLWDMRVMFNDYMTRNLQAKPILSTITLALLKDTGWYEVNYNAAQVPVFGRNAGCGFIYNDCVVNGVSSSKELWCDGNTGYTCDAFANSKAVCNIGSGFSVPQEFQYFPDTTTSGNNPFPDFCPFNFPYPSGFCKGSSSGSIYEPLASEVYGINSKCFVSTLVQNPYSFSNGYAACYEVIACSPTDATVKIGSSTVSCPFTGKTITLPGYSGSLTCPNSNILCRDAPCLNACYGSGACINGFCKCYTGYSGDDCSIICQSNCAVCTSPTSCSYCISQYGLLNGVCVLNGCPSNCIACSSNTVCTLCNKGYYKSSTGKCVACNAVCTECTSSTVCTACVSGRYLTSTKACAVCPSTCATCVSSTVCTSCKTSYFLDSSQKCSACSTNCLSCTSATVCVVCKDGYYVSSTNACVVCPTGCALCSPDLTCSSCKTGYYLNSSNKCVVCSTGCASCVVGTQCITCKTGYYLNASNTCTICATGCASCVVGTQCVTCKTGYYLNASYTCTICSTGCASCVVGTECTTCSTGYYLMSTKLCGACITGCSVCQNSTQCVTCKTGYTITTAFTCV